MSERRPRWLLRILGRNGAKKEPAEANGGADVLVAADGSYVFAGAPSTHADDDDEETFQHKLRLIGGTLFGHISVLAIAWLIGGPDAIVQGWVELLAAMNAAFVGSRMHKHHRRRRRRFWPWRRRPVQRHGSRGAEEIRSIRIR